MKKNIILLAALVPFIVACGGNARDSLGLRKTAPDEFKVVSNPPLSLPPEFSLRPPAKEVVVIPAEVAAKRVLFEKASADIYVPTSATNGESAFLKRIGASEADSEIKAVLRKEEASAAQADKRSGLFGKLTKLSNGEKEAKEPVVSALDERDRIVKNKQEGKSITDGDTPTVTEEKSLLKRVFGI